MKCTPQIQGLLFHSPELLRHRQAGGSRWSGRYRTCSIRRGCLPGSPRSPHHPPVPPALPCLEGTVPLWACQSSAASVVPGPAALLGFLLWRSADGGRTQISLVLRQLLLTNKITVLKIYFPQDLLFSVFLLQPHAESLGLLE